MFSKTGRFGKADRVSRFGKADRAGRFGTAGRAGTFGKADRAGTAGKVGTAGARRIRFKRVINYPIIWAGTSNTVSLSAECLTLVRS